MNPPENENAVGPLTKADDTGPRRKASLNEIKDLYCALHDLVITSMVPVVVSKPISPISETADHFPSERADEVPVIVVDDDVADCTEELKKISQEGQSNVEDDQSMENKSPETSHPIVENTISQQCSASEDQTIDDQGVISKSTLEKLLRDNKLDHSSLEGKKMSGSLGIRLRGGRPSVFKMFAARKISTQSNPEIEASKSNINNIDHNKNNNHNTNINKIFNDHNTLTRKVSCPPSMAPCEISRQHGKADKSFSAPVTGQDLLPLPSVEDFLKMPQYDDSSHKKSKHKSNIFSRMRSKSMHSAKRNSKKAKRTLSSSHVEQQIKNSDNKNTNSNRNSFNDDTIDIDINNNENITHNECNEINNQEEIEIELSESDKRIDLKVPMDGKKRLKNSPSNILGSIERLVSALHLEESPTTHRQKLSTKSVECELSKLKLWFNKAAEEATRHRCQTPLPRTSTYSSGRDAERVQFPGGLNDHTTSAEGDGEEPVDEDHHGFVGRRRSSSAPDPPSNERFCSSYGYQCTTFV